MHPSFALQPTTKTVIVPVFISHMGCPHRCVFCDQNAIAGAAQMPSFEALHQQVITWRSAGAPAPELAFYGGSFTAIPVAQQIDLLASAKQLLAFGAISGIRLSTRPDALPQDALERLKAYHVRCVEIGVQSLSDDVLVASGRGHDADATRAAIKRVQDFGFVCGAQLMVGLPKDSKARSLESVREVIRLGVDFVRIYPTVVFKNTELEAMWQKGTFIPWTADAVIDCCADMAALCQEAAVPVVRIGLQDTPQLQRGADIVAGVHHPAMGELVKSRLWRNRLEKTWLESGRNKELLVRAPQRLHSQLIGQKKCNVTYFQEQWGVRLKIITDNRVQEYEIGRQEPDCI